MRRAIFNVCAGLAAGLMLVGTKPAEAIGISIQGMPAAVTAGDAFSVDIVVTGIVDEIITAWDIDVAFDSALLSNGFVTFNTDAFGGATEDDSIFDAHSSKTGSRMPSWCRCWAMTTSARCSARAMSAVRRLTLATLGFTAAADGVPMIGFVNWGLLNDIKCADNFQCYPR
jgi:hypothetical protein